MFKDQKIIKALMFLATLMPLSATAEPGVSHGHIPWLWGGNILLALLIGWLIWVVSGKRGFLQQPKNRWLAVIIIVALYLIFVAPLVVIFGSILITGRTM